MDKLLAVFSSALVIGMFVISGLFGIIEVDIEQTEFTAGTTAMENMTEDITELITQIIPVFVTIGVFGVIVGMILGLMKRFSVG